MKTIPAALQTHLDSRSTTLATMWTITPVSGTVMRFTTHDADLVYGGNTYASLSGYTPTSIRSSSALNVDNLDIQGLITSVGITRADLAAGVYDNAAVRLFLVNYESLGDGEIKVKAGRLGEVRTAYDFVAEFRSLTQQLQSVIGSIYSPDCRYDVGDANCGIPIGGQTATGSHRYWKIDMPANLYTIWVNEVEMALAAGGSDVTGSGTPTSSAGTAANGFDGSDGTYISMFGASWIKYDFGSGNDKAILEIRLKATTSPSLMPSAFNLQWSDDDITYTTSFAYTGQSYTSLEQKSYIAGIIYYEDFEFTGTITSVTDNANFADSALTQADGFFNYGKITFTSGLNNGLSREIRVYVQSGGVIEMFEPFPYDVATSDAYTITAGCDKTFSVCKAKFNNAINFGGEPHVPGQSVIGKFGGQ